ncbi:hypothetical protein ACP4OV_012820 [Aristida adscensionis]
MLTSSSSSPPYLSPNLPDRSIHRARAMAHPSPPPPSPPPTPPPPPPLPWRPLPHYDTTLTLALPLPRTPSGLNCPVLARSRLPDGAAAAAAKFARVRSSPTGDTPPCTECGKRFPSWKALFGHMRCHPERQWRGITPPAHFRRGGGAPAAAQFTVQELDVAESLLILAGVRPAAAKGKKSPLGLRLGSPSPKKERYSTSSTSSLPPPASRCDDHKCSVCDRGFATGQALGGHKRCHWDSSRAGSEVVVAVANCGGCSGSATSETSPTVATAATLDLNLPPPGPPLRQKNNDQGGGLSVMLDLKLGY